ncbi:hypothetical protein T4A_7894 [Trichinella pseudospiralis]|uniref:Uncharacterized protein n=1 Tax=Trichinella pseudospiralis TaxID=6337 RepID=A0A0V1EQB1_TRIPS|nr:hypothetical protein T4A_7894 [Trichinella pseudospiralis]
MNSQKKTKLNKETLNIHLYLMSTKLGLFTSLTIKKTCALFLKLVCHWSDEFCQVNPLILTQPVRLVIRLSQADVLNSALHQLYIKNMKLLKKVLLALSALVKLLTYVSQTLKIHHREQFPMHAKKSENAIGTNQITDTTTQNKRREETR